MQTNQGNQIKGEIQKIYGKIADGVMDRKDFCCKSTKGNSESTSLTKGIYSEQQLTVLPDGAKEASLGCGNPTAIANLKSGDVVLDLGSGGGIDCFLAANKVGPTGRVIGIDSTPEMVRLAKAHAGEMGLDNVEFLLGDIGQIPLEDNSVDVIISNCVINLALDKDTVFQEAYRVLKPGGLITFSDIVLYGELPEIVRSSIQNWAGCLAGALNKDEMINKMKVAGLKDLTVTQEVFIRVEDFYNLPDIQEAIIELKPHTDISSLGKEMAGKIASITISGYKPR
ncbi:MAG: arsenite methyltransferase [Clostridia bacterium]|nr:arsenite methyltransferase [Clostridia bacterium]